MKRTRIYLLLLLIFLVNPLFAQEIPYHESGTKSDFRVFLLEEQAHDFDVVHYKFE
jgi:hypothetical protein